MCLRYISHSFFPHNNITLHTLNYYTWKNLFIVRKKQYLKTVRSVKTLLLSVKDIRLKMVSLYLSFDKAFCQKLATPLLWWKNHYLRYSLALDPGNYHPASLPSVPGKILEQILLEAVVGHRENREVLETPAQLHQGQVLADQPSGLLGWSDYISDRGRATDLQNCGKPLTQTPITTSL